MLVSGNGTLPHNKFSFETQVKEEKSSSKMVYHHTKKAAQLKHSAHTRMTDKLKVKLGQVGVEDRGLVCGWV